MKYPISFLHLVSPVNILALGLASLRVGQNLDLFSTSACSRNERDWISTCIKRIVLNSGAENSKPSYSRRIYLKAIWNIPCLHVLIADGCVLILEIIIPVLDPSCVT